MAPAPVERQANGFQPPPSSILATHVVHGEGVPDLDRHHFNQLLTEALGSDAEGQPNLGDDVSVNHKLICIIFQVGIQPALEETPFQTSAAPGKVDVQLRRCLAVLQVAIERSPQVLFVKSDPPGRDVPGPLCPLYYWLIPRLLPLLSLCQDVEARDAVLDVFNAMLEVDRNCGTPYLCDNVLDFMRCCVLGKMSVAHITLLERPLLTSGRSRANCHLMSNIPSAQGYHHRCRRLHYYSRHCVSWNRHNPAELEVSFSSPAVSDVGPCAEGHFEKLPLGTEQDPVLESVHTLPAPCGRSS